MLTGCPRRCTILTALPCVRSFVTYRTRDSATSATTERRAALALLPVKQCAPWQEAQESREICADSSAMYHHMIPSSSPRLKPLMRMFDSFGGGWAISKSGGSRALTPRRAQLAEALRHLALPCGGTTRMCIPSPIGILLPHLLATRKPPPPILLPLPLAKVPPYEVDLGEFAMRRLGYRIVGGNVLGRDIAA